jgi:hypothetical protein
MGHSVVGAHPARVDRPLSIYLHTHICLTVPLHGVVPRTRRLGPRNRHHPRHLFLLVVQRTRGTLPVSFFSVDNFSLQFTQAFMHGRQ